MCIYIYKQRPNTGKYEVLLCGALYKQFLHNKYINFHIYSFPNLSSSSLLGCLNVFLITQTHRFLPLAHFFSVSISSLSHTSGHIPLKPILPQFNLSLKGMTSKGRSFLHSWHQFHQVLKSLHLSSIKLKKMLCSSLSHCVLKKKNNNNIR